MPTRSGKTLLTRDDWSRAALLAIGEGGVDAVAVDRLAKSLKASRGSFYWHFRDRADLVAAALELWAREYSSELAEALDAIEEPVERLRALLRGVYEQPADAVELRLSAAGDDPDVGPVVAGVTRQRLAFLKRIFTDLGFSPSAADDRAWFAYAFFIGHHQLSGHTGTAAQRPENLGGFVDLLVAGSPLSSEARGT